MPHERIAAILAAQYASRMSGKSRAKARRLRMLKTLERLLHDNRKAILVALETDLRKPPMEAYAADIAPVLVEIRIARRKLSQWMRPIRTPTSLLNWPAHSSHVPQPYGTALIIGPWNYPFGLVLSPLVSALAAGNSAIIKPSEYAPASSATLASLCQDAFDPADVACLTGGVETARQAIAAGPNIVFFTGGSNAGRAIMGQCADRLIPVVLELGGCNPCIVERDTRIDTAAARIAWGKFFNAGQTCLAPNTCYVHRAVKDELIGALSRTIRRFYGSDPHASPDFARIVNRHHCERLQGLLQQPHQLHVGGDTNVDECYIAPTVLESTQQNSPLVEEEIFGPILPIVAYEELETVLQTIRRRPPPLAVYAFAESEHIRRLISDKTVSGSLCINGTLHMAVSPRMPFGGVGKSGMGRYHGKAGFDAFSYRRAKLEKNPRWEVPLVYPPYRTPTRLAAQAIKRLV